jgi:NADPH:quinone reductase-like Zn-dependent oxidoreductase
MQAWLTTGAGIDELVPHEVVVPSLGPNDVLIEVRALSLNYRDLLVIEGVDGWKPPRAVVPICDALGVVVQTGAASRRFAIGDRVLPTYLPKWRTGPLTDDVYVSPVGGPQNRGFLSQFAAVDEQELVAAPQSVDDLRAATLPIAGVTAWHSLQRTAVHRDDWVLVHGTGGVALYATQLAHALGANVIVTSSSDDKLRRVRDLGADASVNYRTEDVAEAVREITQGRGVDIVVETVGGDNLNVSLDACSVGARIAFIGLIGGVSAQIDTYRFVQKHVTVHGIETGSREHLEQLVHAVDEYGIQPVIDSRFAMDRIQDALRHLKSGAHFGKVVVADP